eukprot:1678185-Pleurochrysis_carterae.AAC.1
MKLRPRPSKLKEPFKAFRQADLEHISRLRIDESSRKALGLGQSRLVVTAGISTHEKLNAQDSENHHEEHHHAQHMDDGRDGLDHTTPTLKSTDLNLGTSECRDTLGRAQAKSELRVLQCR